MTRIVNRTVMQKQTQVRMVPVVKNSKQNNRKGKETEAVNEEKVVEVDVPVNHKATMVLNLSTMGSEKEDATTEGFVYE